MEKTDFSPDWVRFKPGYPVKFDPFKDAEDFYLDQDAGQQAIDFFPECLHHIKGEKALQPLELELWQRSIIGHLFGWKSRETDLNRPFVWLEVQGNGSQAVQRSICLDSEKKRKNYFRSRSLPVFPLLSAGAWSGDILLCLRSESGQVIV